MAEAHIHRENVDGKNNGKTKRRCFFFSDLTQPQYAVIGQTTKPTDRSARAMETKMKLDGDERSFLRGSFQTANKTRKLPSTIMGAMTIESTEQAAHRGLTFSIRSEVSCTACSLVMFQKL